MPTPTPSNPTTITMDLPPHVLDKLEAYVRARTVVLSPPEPGAEGIAQRRVDNQIMQSAAELALFYLMLEMRGMGLGTLGEAIDIWSAQGVAAERSES